MGDQMSILATEARCNIRERAKSTGSDTRRRAPLHAGRRRDAEDHSCVSADGCIRVPFSLRQNRCALTDTSRGTSPTRSTEPHQHVTRPHQ